LSSIQLPNSKHFLDKIWFYFCTSFDMVFCNS
jgi:hypothetical protein